MKDKDTMPLNATSYTADGHYLWMCLDVLNAYLEDVTTMFHSK